MPKFLTQELQLVVKDFEGNPKKTKDATGQTVDLTVRQCLRTALTSTYQDEVPNAQTGKTGIEFTKAIERHELAKRIFFAEEEVTLTTEEMLVVKQVLGKLLVGDFEALGFVNDVLEKKATKSLATPAEKE